MQIDKQPNVASPVILVLLAFALSPASSLGGCGISEKIYKRDTGKLKDRIAVLEGERDTLRGERDACQGDAEACARELAAMQSRGETLDAGLAKALQRIRGLEAVTAAQRAVFDRLRSALDELVRAGKLSIVIVRGQFTVQMAEKILFDSGKADLKAEARETLVELTTILASIPERRYQIAGHTDSRGSDSLNWRLSGSRARAVLKFMIDNGMSAPRVSYAGYGPYQPTAPNDTPDNMALNRRIEIVLVPDMEAFLAPFAGKS